MEGRSAGCFMSYLWLYFLSWPLRESYLVREDELTWNLQYKLDKQFIITLVVC
jgi:hypothetical protein